MLITLYFISRGDAFYPTLNTLGVEAHKDSEEAVNKLAEDVEKQ